MKRRRTIAGTPLRSGFDSWAAIVAIVVASLESSKNIPEGSVSTELEGLEGIGAALTVSHLAFGRVTLVAEPLWVEFDVITGEAAFEVDEDHSVVPGSATADGSWKLYLPEVPALKVALEAAVKNRPHVKLGKAPEPVDKAAAFGFNAEALRQLEGPQ